VRRFTGISAPDGKLMSNWLKVVAESDVIYYVVTNDTVSQETESVSLCVRLEKNC